MTGLNGEGTMNFVEEAVKPETGVKGFRKSEEAEAFYRFVYDNDLREEALAMLRYVKSKIGRGSKRGRKKKIQ